MRVPPAIHFVYRRGGSSTYRVIFAVQEEGMDGPTVLVLAVRLSAAKPITGAEAREIEA